MGKQGQLSVSVVPYGVSLRNSTWAVPRLLTFIPINVTKSLSIHALRPIHVTVPP